MGLDKALVGSAVDELKGVDLGDVRLEVRLRRIAAALEKDPATAFPAAVATVAEREAVYRLLRNERVGMKALLSPHAAQTVVRAKALGERPLVAIDKTSFVFPGEAEREGLERLGKNRHGLDAFCALAISRARRPLGVLALEPLEKAQGRSGADDWEVAVEAAASHIEELGPIYVMDREADAFALFASLIAKSRDFVVRVASDRWVNEYAGAVPEMLRTIAARAPVALTREVKLSRRTAVGKALGARRRHPPRDGRDAQLRIRACSIVLPRPRKLHDSLPESLSIQLVQVVEENPPDGTDPVEWLLFTTLPVGNAEEVAAVIDTYRARWTIEEYFKALKSGCNYEKRQLESRHTLLNALGILAPLAWRLLALRSVADDPTIPVSTVLDADEVHVLRKLSRDIKLNDCPTAAQALYAIARLGGHFPQNGRPGWKVLWTGFQKLLDRVEGYRLAREEM
jgi:transposase-like protein/DDE family transposase